MPIRLRLIISLVTALCLLWLAVPRLPMYGTGMEFGYSILWLSFCLLVIAANFYALLRLGRGEAVEKPALTQEQRRAIRNIQRNRHRYRRRGVSSR